MKKDMQRIVFFVFIVLCLSSVQIQAKEQTASLSYVYKYEVKPTQNVAEVILQISYKSHQLSRSYEQVDSIVKQIQKLTSNYCLNYQIQEKDCNTTLQIIDEQTETLYKVVNQDKSMVFSNFLHKQTLKVRVYNAKNVANLIDDILKISNQISVFSFDWIPENQGQIYQQAMKAGVQEGFKMCEGIRGDLESVLKIQEIVDFQVQDLDIQTDEQEEDQIQLQQQNTIDNASQGDFQDQKPFIKWRFQVLCKLK